MIHTIRKSGISTLVFLITSITAQTAFSAPGILANSPLFVSNAVEPNVFFTLDDSGSMDWEAMIPDTGDFTYNNGVTRYNGNWQAYLFPGWDNYQYYASNSYNTKDKNIIPPARYSNSSSNALIQSFWVMQNHNYNSLYYNPETTYTPWKGVDSSGNALYTDADPYNVLRDPNVPGGDKVDITQSYDYYDNISAGALIPNASFLPSYFTWTDTNGNGILEVSEPHTLVEITPSTPTYSSGRNYTDELQNFANWFQFYRKREFATKASIGAVINNADSTRMGLRLINGGHKNDLATMTNNSNKRNLLNTFYGINSNSGTPLRKALKKTGQMFQSTSGTPAIFSAADGGECQQNFTILMTDGFWNGGNPDVGNTDYSANADNGFDGDQTESNDGGNYEDNNSNTLADVAMKYYETDLRGDLANLVPTRPGVDENDQQHMVTYTVSFGVTGTIDPDNVDPLANGFIWPKPDSDPKKVDDLMHAAYNGRGLYLNAQNPIELENSLNAAIEDIAERTATAAAASVTSAALTTDSIVYLSEFNTNRWQGTVYAFSIKELDEGGSLNTTPIWSAADLLNTRTPESRTILTYDRTTAKDGVAFRWNAISTAMKNDLKTNSAGGTDSDTVGKARLEYLRGSRADESAGYNFRSRATLLGDIVHSGPVYVAQPGLRWPDKAPFQTGANSYKNFKEAKKDRDPTLYVGSNDGMLHAFDAETGNELLAYIPSNLSSTANKQGLHYLTQQNYAHKYYNDLTPSVSDVYINANGSTGWKTILISGQRAGGRGYTALDITNPATFGNENNADKVVLWEFSSDDDADLGYTFSKPQIGMTNDGEWVAVFGNGYNSTGDGEAKLFIVKIAKGVDGTWSATDYTKISTGVGTTANPNGLATPALADTDEDGDIDVVYAGDLKGNLWKFDLSATTTASWTGTATRLFTTIGNRPITSKPALSRHPTITTDGTNSPNIMVTFGTGQYMVSADKNSTNSNYFYGVWDKGSTNRTAVNLVKQTYRAGFSGKRVLTQNDVDYSTYFGWYIPMPDSGERIITNPIIRSNTVFFNTNVPTATACSVGGYGYRFAVDLATGGTPTEPVIDTSGDGKIDDDDTTGSLKDVVSAEKFERLLTDDTITQDFIINDRDLSAIRTAPPRQTGRISWQELLR